MVRRDGSGGFTLIELMIVVAIIAIIAAIAIPNLLSARLNANETGAIATLRNLSSAEAQFQASAKCDVDGDGVGEFGMFRELSGAAPVRTATNGTSTGTVLNPPVISGAFGTMATGGYVSRSGYVFRVWLHGANNNAVGENTLTTIVGGGGTTINTDMCETIWCAYAWPANFGSSGNRTFFVNQAGDIVANGTSGYSAQPNAGAAFVAGGVVHRISGKVAVGVLARDGAIWTQVN